MKRYDLNLLLSLDALLRERSVSAAAKRLGIGQPAMSAALARLRALFDDPILVRSGQAMTPTARGRELAEPLRSALEQFEAMIEPLRSFDASSAERTFRITGGDYVGMTILPRLVGQLARAAPGIDIRYRYLEKDVALKALDEDASDLALLVMDDLPSRFQGEALIEETFVCAARAGHPVLGVTLDLAGFAKLDHLLVTERGDATGCVDTALAREGLSRRIAITVPSAALVADILRATDLVATVARRAGERMALAGGVRLFEAPISMPGWRMRVVWPNRTALDPALVWLRGQLRAAASDV